MPGVSKHYLLTTPDGRYFDYAIPVLLANEIPRYAVTVARAGLLRGQLNLLLAQPISWRRKINAMWSLADPPVRNHITMKEFTVYPGRSERNCGFRAHARAYREFRGKIRLKEPDIPRVVMDNGIMRRMTGGELRAAQRGREQRGEVPMAPRETKVVWKRGANTGGTNVLEEMAFPAGLPLLGANTLIPQPRWMGTRGAINGG